MTFSAPFSRVIARPFGGVPATSSAWWLAGGINPANCVAAYQAKGAASLAASYVNLANPGTYDAAAGSAPAFDTATGWDFNGSANYLVIAGLGISDSPLTMIARFKNDNNGEQKALMSIHNSSTFNRLVLLKNITNKMSTYNGGSTFGNTKGTVLDGNYHVSASVETSDTSHATILDAVTDKATASYNLGLTSLNTGVIGARNNGSYGLFFDGIVVACAYYNIAILDAQFTALAAAMAAL